MNKEGVLEPVFPTTKEGLFVPISIDNVPQGEVDPTPKTAIDEEPVPDTVRVLVKEAAPPTVRVPVVDMLVPIVVLAA